MNIKTELERLLSSLRVHKIEYKNPQLQYRVLIQQYDEFNDFVLRTGKKPIIPFTGRPIPPDLLSKYPLTWLMVSVDGEYNYTDFMPYQSDLPQKVALEFEASQFVVEINDTEKFYLYVDPQERIFSLNLIDFHLYPEDHVEKVTQKQVGRLKEVADELSYHFE